MTIQKRFFALALTLVLAFGAIPFTASADNFPCVGIVLGNEVNVRTNAGTEFPSLGRLNWGSTLDVFDKIGDWYKIGTGNGNYAYIYASYVSTRPQDVASRGEYAAGNRVLQLAKQYLGTPYVYGGSSPSGFDCSGFTSYIYRQLGYNINRVAHDQLANGVPVNKSELKPGDIVFFKRAGNSTVHHVGIYAGDGMMIHSPQTGDVVKYTSITTGYYNNVYYTARRIIH